MFITSTFQHNILDQAAASNERKPWFEAIACGMRQDERRQSCLGLFYLSELESVYLQGLWSYGWMTSCLGWLLLLSNFSGVSKFFFPLPVSRRGFLMFQYPSIRSKTNNESGQFLAFWHCLHQLMPLLMRTIENNKLWSSKMQSAAVKCTFFFFFFLIY